MLRKCEKKEAKLIGYDEMPSEEIVKSCGLKVPEISQSDYDTIVYPLNEIISTTTSNYHTISGPIRELPSRQRSSGSVHSTGCKIGSTSSHLNNGSETDPQGKGTDQRDFSNIGFSAFFTFSY